MSDRILVATRKGLFDLRRNGAAGASKWSIDRVSFLADNCTMVMRDPRGANGGDLYAALNHGHFGCKLHRSEDDGANWTEIAAPAYPENTVIEPNEMNLYKEARPATLELIWALEPGGADQPGRLWLGTIPGGLFRSDDRGESWSLVESLWNHPGRAKWFGGGYDRPGIHSIIVDPRDSSHVTLGVSCGGVWETRDDGATWELLGEGLQAEYMPPDQAGDREIQDPHLIAACANDPDKMWIQHHNGIFRSTDGAKNWEWIREVEPSGFGFGVAVHPRDGDTAWFVPAIKDEHRVPVDGKLVVTRTRDGGKSFDILRDGLPQKHAYDLVFRHALIVDESGDRLAFGSTTGSLWTSDNGGDSWSLVSAHLPPVYAMRFA
ncbi:MAG: WD40/YVTN/BNR-like repeat-containing protein [Phycisphaerales bacterium]